MLRSTSTGRRTLALGLLFMLLAIAVVLPGVSEAQVSGLGGSVTPGLSTPVVVGDQDQPAEVRIRNAAVGAASTETVTAAEIQVNPSCQVSVFPCPTPEPRSIATLAVFLPSVTGLGRVDTSCATVQFNISGPDMTGNYNFNPVGGPVTLGPSAGGGGAPAICIIDFSFDVLQRPNDGATFAVARVELSSPSFPEGLPQTGASSSATINQAVAALTTQASTNAVDVVPGSTVFDTAILTPPVGGPVPTGNVTYALVGPDPDAGCTAPVVAPVGAASQTVALGSPSPNYVVNALGAYNFTATYTGDVNYLPVTDPVGCGVAVESFAVARRPVVLTTQASTNSATVVPGSTVFDTALLLAPTGGPTPTGTVTYGLFGPNPNGTCTSPVVPNVGAVTETVSAGSPSPNYIVTGAGVYNFTATYSGDANYLPITAAVGCGEASERFAVALRPVGLATQASTNSPTVPPGSTVTDTATFTPPTGGPPATGNVTYTLVGPGPNVGCTAPVVGMSTKPVGTASDPFTVTAPGIYNFTATYTGDANYAAITTPVGCGDPNERFAVALRPITLSTQASTNDSAVPPGSAVTDMATLTPPAGAPVATGTVTYTLVGPGPDANCTAPVVGRSTKPVGTASDSFTVTVPGTYNFLATYSGDVNYAPIAAPVGCGVAAERFTVAPTPTAVVPTPTPVPPVAVVQALARTGGQAGRLAQSAINLVLLGILVMMVVPRRKIPMPGAPRIRR